MQTEITTLQPVTSEWLQSIEALADVPADQLQWMIDNSLHRILAEGEYVARPGDPIAGCHIIISGRVKLYMLQKSEIVEVNILQAKDVSGALPFSRAVKATLYAKAIEEVNIMTLPIDKFRQMVSLHYELTGALVHVMTNRVRNFTAQQQQNDKMLALGKLSAGLAHELNNPAAAIVRGAESLKQHLQLEPELFKDVMNVQMQPKDVDFVQAKLFEILGREERPRLTLVQRTELEDEMRDCLEDMGVERAEEVAENFMEFGFTCEDMEAFHSHTPDQYLSPVLNWINTNLVTERMVQDIQEAAKRIFNLIQSVKTFTHMDQGKGKELIDIHTGIDSTLVMMQYKLRKGNIEVVEEFDNHLPKVMALVGELNQVWTNLIDNAVDAMEVNGRGRLTIRTEKDHSYAKISIIDDGPGIPEEIKSSIFDPFFTTKGIGKGTGLGLDVVNRIVVGQHHGSVKVNSVPGKTEFIVCLPIGG
ncbi:ATP-binding protein [Puia dinghuensis]|uniref:histidine kinase n=1 Tax=Puia dinghuensis TaxID=1792502 RepID=A0A8J2U847_9BACT|nr:ATP-binding protein [Puia dinghuensis]GGA85904.1 sensor histidine kinase [Puia dinghuensis]